jgi:hypothetical protein
MARDRVDPGDDPQQLVLVRDRRASVEARRIGDEIPVNAETTAIAVPSTAHGCRAASCDAAAERGAAGDDERDRESS